MGWLVGKHTKEDKRIRVFIHLPTVTNNFHIPGFNIKRIVNQNKGEEEKPFV